MMENEHPTHLSIAIEQLLKRIQGVEPMTELDAQRIAGHLINQFLVAPGIITNKQIQAIIDIDRDIL